MVKLSRYVVGYPYYKSPSYEKRRQYERDRVVTKGIEREIKDEVRNKVVEANKQRAANKERRDLNRVKAGQYQVIKDTTKIRKYDKKARHKVIKMSPEMIENLMARKSQLGGI